MNFDQRIRDLVAHAYAHAPAVRDRLDQAGVTPADIQSAADLAKIPVLPKDALVDLQRANPPFGGLLRVRNMDQQHDDDRDAEGQ